MYERIGVGKPARAIAGFLTGVFGLVSVVSFFQFFKTALENPVTMIVAMIVAGLVGTIIFTLE